VGHPERGGDKKEGQDGKRGKWLNLKIAEFAKVEVIREYQSSLKYRGDQTITKDRPSANKGGKRTEGMSRGESDGEEDE